MLLKAPERLFMMLLLVTIAINFIVATTKGIEVVGSTFLQVGAIAIIAIAVGLFFRTVKKDPILSLFFLNFGLFAIYSHMAVLYSHLLPPFEAPLIDGRLVELDAYFGFHWPSIMAYAAQYPHLTDLSQKIYEATTYLVFATFFITACHNDEKRVHTFLFTVSISAILTITIWAFLPSAGASAFWELDPEIERIVDPLVSTKYGQELNQLLLTGFSTVSSVSIKGLIGFPSFHTVMALVCVYGLWGYWKSFALAFPIILATIPTIFTQGGHNLMDFFGGLIVTIISVLLAQKIYQWSHAFLGDEKTTCLAVQKATVPNSSK